MFSTHCKIPILHASPALFETVTEKNKHRYENQKEFIPEPAITAPHTTA